jgi:hypothetical protein
LKFGKKKSKRYQYAKCLAWCNSLLYYFSYFIVTNVIKLKL